MEPNSFMLYICLALVLILYIIVFILMQKIRRIERKRDPTMVPLIRNPCGHEEIIESMQEKLQEKETILMEKNEKLEKENLIEAEKKTEEENVIQKREEDPGFTSQLASNPNRESETIDSIEPIELVDDCLEELANKEKLIEVHEITNGHSDSLSVEPKVSQTTVEITYENSVTLEMETQVHENTDKDGEEVDNSGKKPKRQLSRIPRIPTAVKK